MRVLVCGSRTVANPKDKGSELAKLEADYIASVLQEGYGHYDLLIQGEAPGADSVAKAWAWRNGIRTADYPAQWNVYGKKAGFVRNALMLSDGKPDLVLGFTDKFLHESVGTDMMLRLARKAGVTIHHFRTDKGQQEF